MHFILRWCNRCHSTHSHTFVDVLVLAQRVHQEPAQIPLGDNATPGHWLIVFDLEDTVGILCLKIIIIIEYGYYDCALIIIIHLNSSTYSRYGAATELAIPGHLIPSGPRTFHCGPRSRSA